MGFEEWKVLTSDDFASGKSGCHLLWSHGVPCMGLPRWLLICHPYPRVGSHGHLWEEIKDNTCHLDPWPENLGISEGGWPEVLPCDRQKDGSGVPTARLGTLLSSASGEEVSRSHAFAESSQQLRQQKPPGFSQVCWLPLGCFFCRPFSHSFHLSFPQTGLVADSHTLPTLLTPSWDLGTLGVWLLSGPNRCPI